jgi:hypothetical protein
MSTIEIQKGVKISLEELLTGVSKLDTSSLEKFSEEINRIIARRKAPAPSERELELIHRLYQPLDKEVQQRYDILSEKNLAETITPQEHEELLSLVPIAEQHNSTWLEALVELSQLRALPLDEVQEQLGIENPNQAA